jgi:hypothetical protein
MLDKRAREFEHWRGDGISSTIEYATQNYKTGVTSKTGREKREKKPAISSLRYRHQGTEKKSMAKPTWRKQIFINVWFWEDQEAADTPKRALKSKRPRDFNLAS